MGTVNFNTCISVNKKLWFVDITGCLMKYDIVNRQTDIIIPENIHELCFKQIIDTMLTFENKIYFLEQDGTFFYEYDIDSNYCNFYRLPPSQMINWGCFAGVYLYKEEIYIFTKNTQNIYCLNVRSKKMEQIYNTYDKEVSCSIQKEDRIYLVSGKNILYFNLDTRKFEKEYKFNYGEIYWINRYMSDVYLLMKDNRVIQWNLETEEKKIIIDKTEKEQLFVRTIITDNRIFLLPDLGAEIWTLDKKDNTISKGLAPGNLEYNENGWSKYLGFCEDTDSIWCANRVANYMLRIDKKREELEWIKMSLLQPEKRFICYKRMNKIVLEANNISLSDFIKII